MSFKEILVVLSELSDNIAGSILRNFCHSLSKSQCKSVLKFFIKRNNTIKVNHSRNDRNRRDLLEEIYT